ncbi:PPE domain-containing protein [Mycolicibacterium sp. XJ1819]
MSNEVRVNPASLRAQATAMTAQLWMTPSGQALPPDALPLAKTAVTKLNENARVLIEYQKWAQAENTRIAEMLTNAAAAYEKIDTEYKDKLDDPGRRSAINAIPLPAPATELPPLPDSPSASTGVSAAGYSDVKKTETDLSAGDHGSSLDAVQAEWTTAQGFVESHAMQKVDVDWEGEAADSAFARMNAFSEWLHQLSAAWGRLVHSAAKLRASHLTAANTHVPIFTRYVALEAQLPTAQGAAVEAIVKELQELQRLSDEVREEYAKNATVDTVQLEDPPGAQRGGAGVSAGGSTGGGGGDRPTGDPEAVAQRMSESLGQAPPTTAKPAGGAPSGAGAPAGGGSPSGGGSPGGGAPTGVPSGVPGGEAPKLPTDPSLRPAAAGRGGGGSGAGGGGGGKGAMPLSAAVTAETVAPAPPIPVATGAAGAGTSPTGAMMGGAMGGMPMHGAGAQQGKEKRRDPRLAPDEDLYTEDRPWTEGVIGNRRRREVQEGKQEGQAK